MSRLKQLSCAGLFALLAACTNSIGARSELVPTLPNQAYAAPSSGTADLDQSLDVYAPKGAHRAPVLVMVHGGGWRHGDKTMARVVEPKATWFLERGFVFVSINYRLVPDVAFPENAKDVAAAIGWVHGHIREWGGDPDRIALMGHSAGAHLAAVVATDPSYLAAFGLKPSDLCAAVLLDSAAYDLPAMAGENGKLPWIQRQAFKADADLWRSASPRWLVAKGVPMPPVLLVHNEREESVSQSIAFETTLMAAGQRVTRLALRDFSHGEVNFLLGDPANDYTHKVTEFLQRAFASQ